MFNIRQILESKPHNPHYLNRYIKFIESIQTQDLSDEYTEMHHIAPKAKDLFPEYKDAPENFIELTARQHIIAHVILWKVYGGSQSTSLHFMLNVQNEETGYSNRKVPTSISIRYAAKAREAAKNARLGKSTFKDSTGSRTRPGW